MSFTMCYVLLQVSGCGPSAKQVGELKYALSMGDVEEVKRLHAEGVDLRIIFENQETTLHLLAESYSPGPELARYLIEQGVDVNAKTSYGQTAWRLVWYNTRDSISEKKGMFLVELLKAGYVPERDRGDNGEPFLHLAAQDCYCAQLIKMLAEGQDIDERDEFGWTALHHAVFVGNYEASAGLLEAGADPNAETKKTISQSVSRPEQEEILYEYQAGSRPMDLHHAPIGENTKNFKKLFDKYGGEKNPNVQNRFY